MEGVPTRKNPYLRVAWIDSICAFFIFLIGVLGGGWLFYVAAAYWAHNAYQHQRLAWEKEDRERASDGESGGEDGEDTTA